MSFRHFLVGTATGALLAVGSMLVFGTDETRPLPSVARTPSSSAPVTVSLPSASLPASPTASPAPAPVPPVAVPSPAPGSAQPPPTAGLAVAMSAEHAKLLLVQPKQRGPLTMPELHALYASESKDMAWALEMEATLRRFLAEAGVDAGFELLTVDCRTSLCEVLAFGNTPDAHKRWNAIGASMATQPWWPQFSGHSSSTSEQNGRTVIATILQRVKS